MERDVQLVFLDDKYIKFLFSKDKHVMFNKGQRRPYLGVLFTYKGHKYYAPLSSPKEKHLKMQNNESFMKLDGGKLGVINFNNMIPVIDSAIHYINMKQVENKYKFLLINQINIINKQEESIIHKAIKLYKAYRANKLRKQIRDICCNFFLLEKEYKKYNPNFVPKN